MFADIFMERLPLEVHMPSPKPIFARRKEMLLRALRYKALMVDGINNTFRDAKMGIEILSFYSATCDARKRIMSVDTIPKKMRLVDPEDRSNPAVFRAKDKKELPLCSRHLNMGRFHGKTDSHYKALVRRIEVAIARVPACKGTNAALTQTFLWPMNLCSQFVLTYSAKYMRLIFEQYAYLPSTLARGGSL